MKPYIQGELDGLCGLYAVVNAVRRLLGWKLEHYTDGELFAVVAAALPRKDYPDVLWEGMSLDQLLRACRTAARYLSEIWSEDIRVETPFTCAEFSGLQSFLSALQPEQGCSTAILWVDWARSEGGHSHWTVLEKITDGHLLLVDSGGQRRLPLKRLGVSGERGRRLSPERTVLLTRRPS